MHEIPTPCPCCGAYSLMPAERTATLLAVCDVLVFKAMDTIGRWLVRVERSRYRELTASGRPRHEAHTLWRADDEMVDKALRGAWDVVPALLESHGYGQEHDLDVTEVMEVLDGYVHDLAITGTVHSLEELRYRLVTRLDLLLPIVETKELTP